MSGSQMNKVDLDKVSAAEASRLMSEEHRTLGYRPPPGSLASEAQAAASKHDTSNPKHDIETLQQAAKEDADRISKERASIQREGLNIHNPNEDQARQLMSEEHKELGYRPPARSLASEVQSEVRKKQRDVDHDTIHEAAVRDARKIRKERGKTM